MRKKYIFIATGILCLLVAGIAFYFYQKPRQNLLYASADYSITAKELYSQFQSDETSANSKYLNKIINVQGEIQSFQPGKQGYIIVLDGGNSSGGINCNIINMQTSKAPLFTKGQSVNVKGRCTGFLMDVNITDAVIEY